MDAASAQTALRPHPGAVLGSQQVVGWHADLVIANVIVQRGVLGYLYPWRLARHHEHAVDAHHEDDVGPRPGAGEPLLAGDHPLVTVPHGASREQARVGPALRLGHRVRREDLL